MLEGFLSFLKTKDQSCTATCPGALSSAIAAKPKVVIETRIGTISGNPGRRLAAKKISNKWIESGMILWNCVQGPLGPWVSENIFFKKIKSATHQALAWWLVWKDPKELYVAIKFRGACSHFSLGHVYIIDFHSAFSQPSPERAEWKSRMQNWSTRKWLEAPLNLI